MTFTLRNTVLIALGAALLGGLLTYTFWKSSYPGRPLFVVLENQRDFTIPALTIEHGNENTQETIIVTQLKPGEKRILSLNHAPGKGYALKSTFPNGEKLDVCVGKNSEDWVNHITLGLTGAWAK